jgi:hypothetical protein
MGDAHDPDVKEIFIVGPTQSGKSDNMIVAQLRYIAANMSKACMYVAAQQEKAEEFYIERIKRGMNCAEITKDLADKAQERAQVMDIGQAQIVLGWAAGKDTFKMRPFDIIFCDELSSWKSVDLLDQARKRFATRPFSKLIGVSSPDPMQKRPSEEDPIWIEYELGDQRKWFCKDPVTGNDFIFEMSGVKWYAKEHPDDEWDLQRVKDTAYYITPDGTRIDEKDRKRVVAGGVWKATAKGLPGKRSYWFNQLLLPFECGQFGDIAKRFLESKGKGQESLRAFIYEVLVEKWKENVIETNRDVISARAGHYTRGTAITESAIHREKFGKASKGRYMTVDVQMGHLWWLVREWIYPGHSGLIDYGYAVNWREGEGSIAELAKKYSVDRVGVDLGFAGRKEEVSTYCSDMNDFMLVGDGKMRSSGMKATFIPSYQGTIMQGQGMHGGQVMLIHFSPDSFKTKLWAMCSGQNKEWYTFDFPGHDYLAQMRSERCVDGHWDTRNSHSQNHLWDCEVMQTVMARYHGVFEDLDLIVEQ